MMYAVFKDFAGPVATVVASVAAAYFARQQVVVARRLASVAESQAKTANQEAATSLDQLRQSLFEKRFAIYNDIQELIRLMVNTPRSQKITANEVIPHYVVINEARFLFPAQISDWMDEVQEDCQTLLKHRDAQLLPSEFYEAEKRLVAHIGGMAKRFEHELGFHQLTRRQPPS